MYEDLEVISTIWNELSDECKLFLAKAFAGTEDAEEFDEFYNSLEERW